MNNYMKIIINAIKQWVSQQVKQVSDDQFLYWLVEENIVSPVANASEELYVTNNDEIYIL